MPSSAAEVSMEESALLPAKGRVSIETTQTPEEFPPKTGHFTG
jgi:hypothetical protein